MKRTKKNRQAECLQTGKSERTAANAAKCANGYGQEKTGSDFRKDEGNVYTSAEKFMRKSLSLPVGWETV